MKGSIFLTAFAIGALVCSCRQEKPLATFGVVTDLHYHRDKTIDHPVNSATKLSEAVQTFNAEKVDFTVSLGDTFDPTPDTYCDLDEIFSRLEKPVYKVLGNHDCIAPYGSDAQNAVLSQMGVPNPYFSFTRGRLRFIFLDGNDISYQSSAEGSSERMEAEATRQALLEAGSGAATDYNGKIGDRQKAWLKRELDNAMSKGQIVIVLGHMPLRPDGVHASLWNGPEIDAMLQEYPNVKAVLSGHLHQGAYVKSGHIHHFTFQGLFAGEMNHYAIVRVYKDRLEISGYGEQPSEVLHFDACEALKQEAVEFE